MIKYPKGLESYDEICINRNTIDSDYFYLQFLEPFLHAGMQYY